MKPIKKIDVHCLPPKGSGPDLDGAPVIRRKSITRLLDFAQKLGRANLAHILTFPKKSADTYCQSSARQTNDSLLLDSAKDIYRATAAGESNSLVRGSSRNNNLSMASSVSTVLISRL